MKRGGRAYGGKSGSERRDERRARLIAAGRALLRRHGWARTSVRAVCAETGLADRYFYESFADRDELLAAVFDDVADDAVRAVGAALAGSRPSLRARARAAVEALFDLLDAEPGTARIVLFETPDSPVVRRHRRAALRRFVALIAEQGRHVDRRKVPGPVDRELTAHALIGAMQELLTAADHGEIQVSRGRLVDHAVAIAEAAAFVRSGSNA